MDLRAVGFGGMEWIDLVSQDRDQRRDVVNTVTNLGFHEMFWNSWVAEQLVAAEEGVSFTELVSLLILCISFNFQWYGRSFWNVLAPYFSELRKTGEIWCQKTEFTHYCSAHRVLEGISEQRGHFNNVNVHGTLKTNSLKRVLHLTSHWIATAMKI
jgi:RNase P/RNase MRP subunit POP5